MKNNKKLLKRKKYKENKWLKILLILEVLCKALDCQPGDILEYREDEETEEG